MRPPFLLSSVNPSPRSHCRLCRVRHSACCALHCATFCYLLDPGYVTGISTVDQSSLERRVNFSELISPSTGPVDTTNVSLYEALKSVIEWTGQVGVLVVFFQFDGIMSYMACHVITVITAVQTWFEYISNYSVLRILYCCMRFSKGFNSLS